MALLQMEEIEVKAIVSQKYELPMSKARVDRETIRGCWGKLKSRAVNEISRKLLNYLDKAPCTYINFSF